MWKTVGIIVGTLALMVVSGIVTLPVTFLILMSLGSARHDGNVEYYFYTFPALVWVPAVIGFLTPGVVVWYRLKRRTRKETLEDYFIREKGRTR